MNIKFSLPFMLMFSIALTGCNGPGEKEAIGTVAGAAAGGFIGSQFGHGGGAVVGATFGAIVGGTIGNAIGRSVDNTDARMSRRAFHRASQTPAGEVVYWTNGRTRHAGTVVAVRDGHSAYGNYCRQFASSANFNGRIERVYGTACRDPNGTWYNAGGDLFY